MPGLVQSGRSSPNMQNIATEGPALSPADKKRNRLGYQRTAVACGHCRRRKIRCVPAFNDTSGRCQNCSRLKKECQFFPVDLPGSAPPKRVRKATNNSEAFNNEGDTSVASSSPGGILRSTSVEQLNDVDDHLDTHLSRESPGLHGFDPSLPMSLQGHNFPNSYDSNHQHHQGQQMLIQSSYSPRTYAQDHINSQFYQQQQYGHSLPSQYSSAFSHGPLPSPMATIAQEPTYEYQTPVSNPPYSWGQPTRSFSSDTPEELSSGFTTPYRTNTFPFFEKRMTNQTMQLAPSSSSLAHSGMESQQNATLGDFREDNQYQPMPMRVHQEWGGGGPDPAQQTSAPGLGMYPQAWYPPHPNMEGMRQDEGQPQVLPSQNHNARGGQHKPSG
ncbi:hypothetical protein A1O7_03199 [Cladophialophora yegresii CBS 114405]|uniref:Zn(2)-C6 fungal-type domain-containing protein n=1 Tax=Cladophialophora yegresii CBS 114405 TaxID=1182544 RepID=W9WCM9_9EURO|nr:uncharacterized protein A1O7_03199 [Cladophialophora yegresii CBS 114405]EXJ62760.1 hypothetical protein A1O7_03199 [Cladophialophora yegresii CBS 114405]